MILDINGLEVLGRRACIDLLREVPIGRVGLSQRALPVILPVNFYVTGRDEIVFRTGEGQKLHAALDGSVVAFEADCYDAERRIGWSVLVQDVARVVPIGDPVFDPGDVGADLWANVEATHLVILGTENISGRRIS